MYDYSGVLYRLYTEFVKNIPPDSQLKINLLI